MPRLPRVRPALAAIDSLRLWRTASNALNVPRPPCTTLQLLHASGPAHDRIAVDPQKEDVKLLRRTVAGAAEPAARLEQPAVRRLLPPSDPHLVRLDVAELPPNDSVGQTSDPCRAMPLDVSVLAELDKLDALEVKVRLCNSVLDKLLEDMKELRWTADVLLSYQGSAAAAAAFKTVAIALALEAAGASLTPSEWAIILRRITIKDLRKSKLLRARLRALHLRDPALAAKLSHLPVYISQDLPSLALRLARRSLLLSGSRLAARHPLARPRWTVEQKIKVLVSFGREEMQRGNTGAIAFVIEQALETDIAGKVVVDGGAGALRRLLNGADPSSE